MKLTILLGIMTDRLTNQPVNQPTDRHDVISLNAIIANLIKVLLQHGIIGTTK